MKNLEELYKKALQEVKQAGIPYGKILSVNKDSKSVRRWGYCKYADSTRNTFDIYISTALLTEDVPDESAIEVIIHEILHTCDGCMNHGSKWKKYADIMNYFGKGRYKITVTDSHDDLQVKFDDSKYKYVVQCNKCGKKYGFARACQTLQYAKVNCITCKCGGQFKVIKEPRT